jgi:signal transduction histidine kinase/DNA-binding response OmpR family regulator
MPNQRPVRAPFDVGGPVGADLNEVDWDATSLGAPETWPQSLKSAVGIVLRSRFSMWMAWGSELVFFCNDAYRRDTLGEKYPWALGRPSREVWSEIWSDISPRIDTVMSTGQASWDEGLQLFLVRSGYVEETYRTFSYSPLDDDNGRVVGMLCVVMEDTERVIGARRLATLRDLAAAVSSVQSEADVLAAASAGLAGDGESLPFTLVYAFGPDGGASLVGGSGVPAGHPVAQASLAAGSEGPWPLRRLAAGETVVIDRLPTHFAQVPTGAWEQPPLEALALPLQQQADLPPFGFLVAGLNPHRPLDAGYRDFVRLVGGQLASGIGSARALDSERLRAERLAELDRTKTAFFTNVSHEFRTPLTLLLGPAEDALTDVQDPLSPGQRHRVEVIDRNAQRLLKLVNALLDFSRIESGSATGSFEPVDLPAYTAELATAFSTAVSRVGLSLEVDCAPLPDRVWVDQDLWAKIVLNLLSNALKFTFEGGITVRVEAGEGDVTLSVADTGTGISAQEQLHLFERFHRVAGAASRTYEGSGIGLALVAELTELHGGSVRVVSEPGHGSTFFVTVPQGKAHLPQEHVADRPVGRLVDVARKADGYLAEAVRWLDRTEPVARQTTDDRPRVLVVDDNADMRDYVSGLLHELYNVAQAGNGAEGLETARRTPPDLILTDVMMPVMNGLELLAALRADDATRQIPVIMLSARSGEEATVDGLDAGADDYLVKPFAARELLARVRSNLELDRVRQTRAQLERSGYLLDQAQRLAQVSSYEIDLATGSISGTEEFFRQLEIQPEDLTERGFDEVLAQIVHPGDLDRVTAALTAALAGAALDYEVRLVSPDGEVRSYRTLGEIVRDDQGLPVLLRGSNQDITQMREAEHVLAAAGAEKEAAAREHSIADELQASLLPAHAFDPDHLQIATYYRAGVEGTQVGGDWYDVIELGAGRTALVLGDVMGRGVQAAAVMGQLRSAVRAYSRLDLPPADVLEHLDAAVRELGSDQIVTCVYAVYDPGERTLTYANAGHLPPLLCLPGQPTRRLVGAASPPLGIGQPGMLEERIALPTDALLVLYTDGLVEHRDSDIDTGIDDLAALVQARDVALVDLPELLVASLLPTGPDDDIAVLLVQIDQRASEESSLALAVSGDLEGVKAIRDRVQQTLKLWGAPETLIDDVVLLVSELVTNAILYGEPPVELRIRLGRDHLVLEVEDRASYLPRRMRPTADDEHGRGLQLTALLASRWGTRPTRDGKVVWCVFTANVSAQPPEVL